METLELVNKNKKLLAIISQNEKLAKQFYVNTLTFVYTYGSKKAKERVNKIFESYYNILKATMAQSNLEEYIKMFRFKEFTGDTNQINYILRNIPSEERFRIYTIIKGIITDNMTRTYTTE